MAHDPAAYKKLRRQFVEAAAKYEPSGYRTFIERAAESEEAHIRTGRCEFVGWIHWFYKPWRKCMIFAPNDGFGERPFSVMKRLCTKAWLWLPEIMAEGVVRVAELHLSPQPKFGLSWAHHQLWIWLLWFDWLWQSPREEPLMPPAAGMDLLPFSSSAGVISDWGLDEANPRIPACLAEVILKEKGSAKAKASQKPAVAPAAADGDGGRPAESGKSVQSTRAGVTGTGEAPAVPLLEGTPVPDGPIAPDKFAWKNTIYPGLSPKPFLALTYLWNCKNRTAERGELAEPVYGDREDLVPETAIAGLRRELNRFFRSAGVPLHARQRKTGQTLYLCLADGLPESSSRKPKKPSSKGRPRR